MNKNVFGALMFVAGAAVGVVASWRFLESTYDQIAKEEIESMREFYEEELAKTEEKTEDEEDEEDPKVALAEKAKDKPDLNAYAKLISGEGYFKTEQEGGDEHMSVKPYVIKPEECGELDGYDVEILTYYADKVLADDWGEIIEDVEGTVGVESLTTFGQYEQDTVFVRNDARQIDYEIQLDLENYPGPAEDPQLVDEYAE